MRLKVKANTRNGHTKIIPAVVWAPEGVFSYSDDKTVRAWKSADADAKQVMEVEAYATDMQLQNQNGVVSSHVLVLAGSDGKFRFVKQNGRVERVIDAHKGAITCLRWSHDGSGIATSGEDGFVKQWSPVGRLRSKLAQNDGAVYALAWSPDNSSVLFCSGRFITVKSLQSNARPLRWKAHEGTVLAVDWNPVTNFIVSGGEDCKYRVWDADGRLLYSGREAEYPITAVSWCPSGAFFVVGSLNVLSLCDRNGWTHSSSHSKTGSILSVAWAPDGTQLAAGGANGTLVYGQLVDRTVEWENFEVHLSEENQILVQDVLSDHVQDELEFKDPVIEMAMAYDHLLVVTARQCYIYSIQNFGTPHIFNIKAPVSRILQSKRFFVLIGADSLSVFSYEGHFVCSPKAPGVRQKLLKSGNVSLSHDAIALLGLNDVIHVLDVKTGKPLGNPIQPGEGDSRILHLCLNQVGLVSERKIAFIDSNRDLYLSTIHRAEPVKIATMVDSVIWHDSVDLLAAISDGKLIVWYYPNIVYIDSDLVAASRKVTDASEYGKGAEFISFFQGRLCVRRADGALLNTAVSPFPSQLHAFCSAGQWIKAIRLCRMVRDTALWTCLSVIAIEKGDLETAEIALGAIEEVEKLEFVQGVMEIPSVESRNAEIMLYRRRVDDAEAILIQAGLVYKAIKLNVRYFRWTRALDLAIQYKTHVDTVLAYRQKFLDDFERQEDDPTFSKYAGQVQVNWKTINAKMKQELEKEQARGSGYRRRMGTAEPSSSAAIPRSDSAFEVEHPDMAAANPHVYQQQLSPSPPPPLSQQPLYSEQEEPEQPRRFVEDEEDDEDQQQHQQEYYDQGRDDGADSDDSQQGGDVMTFD